MKKILSILLAIAIFVSFNSSAFTQPVSDPSQGDNRFAFDLYSRLSVDKGNIFFSPYSLSSALEMAYEGARGETAQQMQDVLHLNADVAARKGEASGFIQQMNSPNSSYELSMANALWAQKAYPFKDDYLKLVKNTYFAEARNLDFVADPEGSRTTINNWVSDKTKNRINDLLPSGSINPHTRLVLTDAVYFKGKWETQFKKEDTKLDTFWLTPDHSVQTDMMELSGKSFSYTDNNQAQVLELPYQGNDLSMIIILPHSKDIQGLEKSLTYDNIKQWQEGIIRQKVNVFFPKFKFDTGYEMSDILSAMGMKLGFDPQNADFSGMAKRVNGENLYISGVYHKAWIETDEEGTEAAAATGTVVMGSMAMRVPLPPIVFRADHPFIFFIQDNKTSHILFMGRVSDPREK